MLRRPAFGGHYEIAVACLPIEQRKYELLPTPPAPSSSAATTERSSPADQAASSCTCARRCRRSKDSGWRVPPSNPEGSASLASGHDLISFSSASPCHRNGADWIDYHLLALQTTDHECTDDDDETAASSRERGGGPRRQFTDLLYRADRVRERRDAGSTPGSEAYCLECSCATGHSERSPPWANSRP